MHHQPWQPFNYTMRLRIRSVLHKNSIRRLAKKVRALSHHNTKHLTHISTRKYTTIQMRLIFLKYYKIHSNTAKTNATVNTHFKNHKLFPPCNTFCLHFCIYLMFCSQFCNLYNDELTRTNYNVFIPTSVKQTTFVYNTICTVCIFILLFCFIFLLQFDFRIGSICNGLLKIRIFSSSWSSTKILCFSPKYQRNLERGKGWDAVAKHTVEKTSPFGLDITPLQAKAPTLQQTVDTFLKFAFQMDSIILNLFSGKWRNVCRNVVGFNWTRLSV